MRFFFAAAVGVLPLVSRCKLMYFVTTAALVTPRRAAHTCIYELLWCLSGKVCTFTDRKPSVATFYVGFSGSRLYSIVKRSSSFFSFSSVLLRCLCLNLSYLSLMLFGRIRLSFSFTSILCDGNCVYFISLSFVRLLFPLEMYEYLAGGRKLFLIPSQLPL